MIALSIYRSFKIGHDNDNGQKQLHLCEEPRSAKVGLLICPSCVEVFPLRD